MNVKAQNPWFDKLTMGFIYHFNQKIILSLSKDSFEFNLTFDAVVQSQAYSADLLAEQVLWQARAASVAKVGTLASDELWHLTFEISYNRPFSFIRRIIKSL
jgi:hypothetical protein